MPDTDPALLSAEDMLAYFARGQLSPVEVLQAVTERVARLNPNLNAFAVMNPDALRAAGESESRWRSGRPLGILDGVPTTVKDLVDVAGFPTRRGSRTTSADPVPDDAPMVMGLKAAGAVILGKTTTTEFGWKSPGDCPLHGITRNPWNPAHTTGGSSSGSAALVAAGEVDMAIGGDQGGSIRMPAALCGLYGMKATHGLVPYTGVMPIESTIDHVGPMTSSVADNALLLEVIAGADGLDPRQYAPVTATYTDALKRGVKGLKIAVVKEGFTLPNIEADVAAKVKAAAKALKKLGADVTEISLPEHAWGTAIWTPVALEGLQAQMMHGNGMGFNWKGLYTTSLLDAHAAWRERADELSDSLKLSMFVGQYFLTHYRGHYYAKAQNLARLLKAKYDEALSQYDLLLMPTVPIKAAPIPPADAPLSLYLQRAFELIGNTAPFDVTGHPAMSVPCGLGDGLPIGMMLVGKFYDESTIYAAAAAFEASGDWKKR